MRRLILILLVTLLAVSIATLSFNIGATGSHGPRASRSIDGSSRPALNTSTATATTALPTPGAGWNPTAIAFVDAFLDRSDRRDSRLKEVATPRLASLLSETDPANLPSAQPLGDPTAATEAGESVTVVQHLSDGTSITFDLVPDPTRPSGWAVTSVRPGEQ